MTDDQRQRLEVALGLTKLYGEVVAEPIPAWMLDLLDTLDSNSRGAANEEASER